MHYDKQLEDRQSQSNDVAITFQNNIAQNFLLIFPICTPALHTGSIKIHGSSVVIIFNIMQRTIVQKIPISKCKRTERSMKDKALCKQIGTYCMLNKIILTYKHIVMLLFQTLGLVQ